MKTEELIQSYQAIYNTLDGLTVSGVENFAAMAGCASHIRTQILRLQEQLQAERAAEEAARKQADAVRSVHGEEPA